jgi:zinc transport system substrate-binding protein
LDADYRSGLAACEKDTIVTSHQAFAYLAERYGFETIAVSGMSPEADLSPRRLAEIADIVRSRGIRHIFFETLVSPKVALTLAREIGAETLVFDPLEGLTDGDRAAGKNYLSIMRENLDNLETALQCRK